jgi:hypothetical protein
MIAKLTHHALNVVAWAFVVAVLIIAAPFIFCAQLPMYYRRLELRFAYNGDEAARDNDKYFNR